MHQCETMLNDIAYILSVDGDWLRQRITEFAKRFHLSSLDALSFVKTGALAGYEVPGIELHAQVMLDTGYGITGGMYEHFLGMGAWRD